MLDKTRAPRRGSARARHRAIQEVWRRAYDLRQDKLHGVKKPGEPILLVLLEDVAAGKYDPSHKITPQSGRQLLEDKLPSAPTDIGAHENLHAYVQARWPTVTSNEHKMIETMMRAHPNISDRTLRIYLGLRRGSVPREEW